jgi:hypothetical protein
LNLRTGPSSPSAHPEQGASRRHGRGWPHHRKHGRQSPLLGGEDLGEGERRNKLNGFNNRPHPRPSPPRRGRNIRRVLGNSA